MEKKEKKAADSHGLKTISLEEYKDEQYGKVGTPERDAFEFELQIELLGYRLRELRKRRKLTQEQLGEILGVKKPQISKLEQSAGNVTVGTLVRVLSALNAELTFKVKVKDLDKAVPA